jgi:urease accessory protein UreF
MNPVAQDADAIAARCRELALECLRLIPATAEEQKPVLLEMAEYWTSLAERAQRREQLDGEISFAPIAELLKARK